MSTYTLTDEPSSLFTPAARCPAVFGTARTVQGITIHHWGVTGQRFESVVSYLRRDGGTSSAHYVAESGRVARLVNPRDAAWHAGSAIGNARTVGIECRPEATDGDYATVAALIRDLRAEFGDIPLYPHKHWKATACPGTWDLDRLDRLARQTTPPTPERKPDVAHLIKGDKAPATYVLDPATGLRRYIDAVEFDVYTKQGSTVTTIPQAQLDALPKVPGTR